MTASQPGGEGGCLVTDLTAVAGAAPPWVSVDDAVDVRLAMLEAMPDVGTATSTFIDLPAGRTGRIDTTFQGRLNSRFYFSDTETWFSLSCVSSHPPDDDWLSIAESFEFLPPEE